MLTAMLDLTDLLVPFCSICAGFSLIGLGALVAVAIEERPRRRRGPSAVNLEVAAATDALGRPADPARAVA
jgi:hypothetical protein